MTIQQIARMVGKSERQVREAAKIADVYPMSGRMKVYSDESTTKIIVALKLSPQAYFGKG